MAYVRMDIQTIVVGGGPLSSLVVLKPHRRRGNSSVQLPIRIGSVESTAISMGIDGTPHERPMTHDLLRSVIGALGAAVTGVIINDVRGTTFYSQIRMVTAQGDTVTVDARPSDSIALAVRTHTPIFADEHVLDTAAFPDFTAVEKDEEQQEMERFHDFVENLSPEDFNTSSTDGDE